MVSSALRILPRALGCHSHAVYLVPMGPFPACSATTEVCNEAAQPRRFHRCGRFETFHACTEHDPYSPDGRAQQVGQLTHVKDEGRLANCSPRRIDGEGAAAACGPRERISWRSRRCLAALPARCPNGSSVIFGGACKLN